MNQTVKLFQKNRELREKWAAVSSADWFREVLVFARATMMESVSSPEAIQGAKKYEEILLTITDPDYEPPPPIKSPLVHAIDNPMAERTINKKEK